MIIMWSMQCGASVVLALPQLAIQSAVNLSLVLLLRLTGDRMINMIKVYHGEFRKASVHQFRANTILAATCECRLWFAGQ